MEIGKQFKIESDVLNITLYEKGKTQKGEVRWKTIGYFSTVSNALKFLVDLEVRESQLTDLKTVVKKQAELYAMISNLPPFSTHKKSVTEGIEVSRSSKLPKPTTQSGKKRKEVK